jgi:hypothetical protein
MIRFLNLLFKNNLEISFNQYCIIPHYTSYPDADYDIKYHHFTGFFCVITWMWVTKNSNK